MKKIFFLLIVSALAINSLNAQTREQKQQWIREITNSQWGRQPDAWELIVENYNSGNFTSKPELVRYFNEYMGSLGINKLTISVTPFKNNTSIALFSQNNIKTAADLITNDGGSIVASGGQKIIAQGGGNVIGNDGASLKGVTIGSAAMKSVLGTGTKIIKTSGSSALIIK